MILERRPVDRVRAGVAHVMKQKFVPIIGKSIGEQSDHMTVEELEALYTIHRANEGVNLASAVDKKNLRRKIHVKHMSNEF